MHDVDTHDCQCEPAADPITGKPPEERHDARHRRGGLLLGLGTFVLVAGGLAFVIWLPNLIWDATHGWPNVAMASVLSRQSGGPLGATIARAELMQWPPGAHASTFGGNPVAVAAALTTIQLLEQELIENAAKVGAHMKGRLAELPKRFPIGAIH